MSAPFSLSPPKDETVPYSHSNTLPASSELQDLEKVISRVSQATTQDAFRRLPTATPETENPTPNKKQKIEKVKEAEKDVFTIPARPRPLFPHLSPLTSDMRNYSGPLPKPIFSSPTHLPAPPLPVLDTQLNPKASSPAMKFTVPPTPRKVSQREMASPYKKQNDELKSGYFGFRNSFFPVSPLAEGSYSAVYIFNQDNPQVIPTISNSELVVKAYHGKIRSGFQQSIMNEYLKTSVQNYRDVTALGLPVATIHNIGTAAKDLVIIQKKIAHDIDVHDHTQILQVQKFFTASVLHNVRMDLQPQNLKNDNGTVVLIDFVEDTDDTTEVLIDKAVRAWVSLFKIHNLSPDEARVRLQELMSGFASENSLYNSQWIERKLKNEL